MGIDSLITILIISINENFGTLLDTFETYSDAATEVRPAGSPSE